MAQLVKDSQGIPDDELRVKLDGPITLVRDQMKGFLESHGYSGFMVVDHDKRILASNNDELIGTEIAPGYLPFFNAAWGGNAGITRALSQHHSAPRRPRRPALRRADDDRRAPRSATPLAKSMLCSACAFGPKSISPRSWPSPAPAARAKLMPATPKVCCCRKAASTTS